MSEPLPVGSRFGLWTVVGPPVGRRVPVRCDCGVTATVLRSNLICRRSSGCLECGWLAIGDANRRHGDCSRRIYRIWAGIRGRCRIPSATGYAHYGGRGITICDEWEDYVDFRDWALANGYTDELTIDRIDPDGPYSPENCRWITGAENSRRARHGPRSKKTIQVAHRSEITEVS